MLFAALSLSACTGPLDRDVDDALRESLIAGHRKALAAQAQIKSYELTRQPSDVEAELTDERRAELDRMSGMAAYTDVHSELGPGLSGDAAGDAAVVNLSLRRAIELTVEHNLDVRVAQLRPRIAQERVTQAEAVFDAVLFAEADWRKLDTPQPGGIVPGLAGNQQQEFTTGRVGVRKNFASGAAVEASTSITRDERMPTFFGTPRFYDADVLVSVTQPILRGFGDDVNRAEVVLAASAQRSEAQALRRELLDRVAATEQAYWDLVFARQQLAVQQRLLERTVDDRDRLKKRADFDATPVQVTEASSFVELRRGEVIRARQQVRDASDRLKRLVNDPDLSVAGETLVEPTELPPESPVTFNLLDAVTTALRKTPQMQQALLAINDASTRQRVAENLQLPLLDVSAGVGLNGIDVDDPIDAYDNLSDADFIDYFLGARFEYPLGNRGPGALARQRRLERDAAVLDYQRLGQDVVIAVKSALRTVATNYELIGSARAARRAAADSLRAIEEQEAAGVALTPEFLLDLKLSTQQRLADAEVQELAALRDYNNALAELYRVMGTLLERNGIAFEGEEP